jgi:hypothetical protein
VLRRPAGRDHRRALTQAEAALRDPEGLAALAGRDAADEGGAGRQLIAAEQAADGQDHQGHRQRGPDHQEHLESAARGR